MRVSIYTFLICFFGVIDLAAQAALSKNVEVNYTELTLIEMLIDMEKQTGVEFYYDPNVLPYYKLSFDLGTVTLFEALDKMLASNNVTFLGKGDNGLIICRKNNLNRSYLNSVIKRVDAGSMKLPDFLLPYDVSVEIGSQATNELANVQINFVDKQTREALIGVSILIEQTKEQSASSLLGACNFKLKPGTYICKGRLIGYRDLNLTLTVKGSGKAEVELEQRLQNLGEVVIQGNQQGNKVENNSTGIEVLSSKEMKALPTFAGEADVIKSLSILPGVSSAGEGTSGFSVRGGNTDQNLVLQDNLPFYNTSHVLGFFSIFNPDLVSNITLYKGDIPAQYGGRLSSVLDVELKTPDFSGWHGSLTGGMIAAKTAIEGPIIKNKVALLFGGRTSYSDWLLRSAKLPEVKASSGSFNDAVAKLNIRFSDRVMAIVEGIYADDYFRYGTSFGYGWSTKGTTATLTYAATEKLFLEANYGLSKLKNQYFDQTKTISFQLDGGLLSQKGHLHMKYALNNHVKLHGGVQVLQTFGDDQNLQPNDASSIVLSRNVEGDNGRESAVFAEGEIKITSRFQLKLGVRGVIFEQLGDSQQFVYTSGKPLTKEWIVDTIQFEKGEVMARYFGIEPRVSMSYKINESVALKASYNRINQFNHLISNTIGATPADVWQPSTAFIGPQVGDNFAVGWAKNWLKRKEDLSVELFYKWATGVPAYKDFSKLLLNDHIETELIAGDLKSYGAEVSFRKQKGRLNGWFSYTYSRVFQRAISPFSNESINNGAWFRGLLDQPHQASVYAKWLRNPSNYFTATFTYRTGKPFSAPRSGFEWNNIVVPYFEARNNLRIPDYHRFDIGYTYDQSQSKLKGLRWILQLSIYNVYSRQNPLSVFFKRNPNGTPSAYQFSPIGAAIPSVQLTFIL
jgi:hypothetical protein